MAGVWSFEVIKLLFGALLASVLTFCTAHDDPFAVKIVFLQGINDHWLPLKNFAEDCVPLVDAPKDCFGGAGRLDSFLTKSGLRDNQSLLLSGGNFLAG